MEIKTAHLMTNVIVFFHNFTELKLNLRNSFAMIRLQVDFGSVFSFNVSYRQ